MYPNRSAGGQRERMTATLFIAAIVLAFGIQARAGEGESDHTPAAAPSPSPTTVGEGDQGDINTPALVPIPSPPDVPSARADGTKEDDHPGDQTQAAPTDALRLPPATTKHAPVIPETQPRWFRLGSYAGMGVGGVALGVGMWQGLASRGARDEYAAARTQIDAWSARRRGEVAAERANGWFIGGGIALGVAAIIFAVDLLDEAESPPPKANAPRISVQGVTW